jgi:hypothetical protein
MKCLYFHGVQEFEGLQMKWDKMVRNFPRHDVFV